MKFLKNKKLIIGIIACLIIVTSIILWQVAFKGEKDETEERSLISNNEIYTMNVKINPEVKLTFKETYYECKSRKTGKTRICSEVTAEVVSYELVNDDAKDIYKELNFNGKTVIEVLTMLCDSARDSNIGFEELNITSNWENMYNIDVLKEALKNNSKYEIDFTITVNFKEYDGEEITDEQEEIPNNEETEKFTINFDSDGGSIIKSQSIEKDGKVKKPTNPTKRNYSFVEWQLDDKKYDFNIKVEKEITLKAVWKKTEVGQSNQPAKWVPTSTIDKINLNENILIYLTSAGRGCGGPIPYIFSTNASTVMAGFISGKSISLYTNPEHSNCFSSQDERACFDELEKRYNLKLSQLIYDTAKENNAKNELSKITKSGYGYNEFEYSFNNHNFTWGYNSIYIYEQSKFEPFSTAFNNKLPSNKLNTIFKDAYKIESGGCGDGTVNNPILLTESICKDYNLTCGRW